MRRGGWQAAVSCLFLTSHCVAARNIDEAPIIGLPELQSWAGSARLPLGAQASPLHEAALQALGTWIGSATVVAFGEGEHLAREPLELRNQLFRYLVEHKGFVAIAIESGLVESRDVDNYIEGAPLDLQNVMQRGIGWTFDRLPQNRQLLAWMREYNEAQEHPKKLHFYGFDISGSPGNTQAQVGPQVAAEHALEYLRSVDVNAERIFRQRLSPWMAHLEYDFACPSTAASYAALPTGPRHRFTRVLSDLFDWFRVHESRYIAKSSSEEYAWGYRAVMAARQLDAWFRAVPGVNAACANPFSILARTDEIRDRYQAQNLRWIEQREISRGGILIFAHTLHLSRIPVLRCWATANGSYRGTTSCARWNDAGTYISKWYGRNLVVLGSIVRGGSAGCGAEITSLEQPAAGSLAGFLAQVSTQPFALDLRTVPPAAAHMLEKVWKIGAREQWRGAWQQFESALRPAFDVLIYFPTVAPACAQ